MKRILFILTTGLLTLVHIETSIAQNNCFPLSNSTGQVEISGKVMREGETKNELYTKYFTWGTGKATMGTASKGGTQALSDREAGIFKFYTTINYQYKEGSRPVYFAITLQIKERYFVYTVNEFSMNRKPMLLYLQTKQGDMYYKTAFEDICQKLNALLTEMKAVK